jgi:S-adenosylmethionine hydrolase
MPIITLTTDFGLRDGFVGTLKGVILGISPDARIVDISHSIAPQNILEGAYALARAFPFFPTGTVHVAVVDPGVGTRRRPIAARLGDQFFVGPDNGLFTPILEQIEQQQLPSKCIHLTNPDYWLPEVSSTFHGRDIFAPVAGYLSNGVALEKMGIPINNPVRITMLKPQRTDTGWIAHIKVVDVFGNLTTDLPASEVTNHEGTTFSLCGRSSHGLVDSYGHKQPGDLVALIDSENYIELAIVNGSAAQTLGARVGDTVEVSVKE